MSNIEFEISEALKNNGISRIAKENNTIVIRHNTNSIRFEINRKSWTQTIKNFEKSLKGVINDSFC